MHRVAYHGGSRRRWYIRGLYGPTPASLNQRQQNATNRKSDDFALRSLYLFSGRIEKGYSDVESEYPFFLLGVPGPEGRSPSSALACRLGALRALALRAMLQPAHAVSYIGTLSNHGLASSS